MSAVSPPMAVAAPSRARPWMQLRVEIALTLTGLLAFVLFPQDLGLLTNIATMSIFALSLSLVLGQAGIATLGQAALYGAGAYVAGWTALYLTADPIVGMLLGGLGGGVIALLSGAVMLRSTKLTLVMLTIAVAQLLLELANWARWLTGGDDGLAGFNISPLLGIWEFNFLGHTGYFYALGTLVMVYFLLRNLVESPFGLTARAIRQDPGRVQALGGACLPALAGRLHRGRHRGGAGWRVDSTN